MSEAMVGGFCPLTMRIKSSMYPIALTLSLGKIESRKYYHKNSHQRWHPNRTSVKKRTVPQKCLFLSLTHVIKRCLLGAFWPILELMGGRFYVHPTQKKSIGFLYPFGYPFLIHFLLYLRHGFCYIPFWGPLFCSFKPPLLFPIFSQFYPPLLPPLIGPFQPPRSLSFFITFFILPLN